MIRSRGCDSRKTSPRAGALLALAFLILTSTSAAWAQGTLFVEGDKVGVGVETPQRQLEVVGTAGIDTQIRVQNQTSAVGARAVLVLENNGPVQVFYRNTDSGNDWQLSAAAQGFSNSLLGTGGPEFRIDNDGRVRMGPGGVIHFNLDPSGDLFIPNGDVHANGVQLTSSREVKTAFRPVEGREVLARLVELPVSEWSFRDDEASVRHIGPVAEDFHAAFNLGGDERSISVTDIAGVTVAAVQGINDLVEEKDSRIASLEQRQEEMARREAELQDRIAALEAMVLRLTEANSSPAN